MAWEGDLQALERAIAALTVEYDAFLYGTGTRPPLGSRKHVERLIRAVAGREPESAADRYRFGTLQGRWSALCDRWDRLQAEKEAGRRPGIYGHFRPVAADAGPVRDHGPNAPAPGSVRPGAESPEDPRRALFEKYLSAKTAKGESAVGYDFDRFAESLRSEGERLRERFGGADVEFDVAERDGRVKLVARRKT